MSHAGAEVAIEPLRPFNAMAFLAYVGARAMPGVERVTDRSYARVVRVGRNVGVLDLSLPPEGPIFASCTATSQPPLVRELVEALVAPSADVGVVEQQLALDHRLQPTVLHQSGLRVPGSTDPLELAVRAVLGQQVSVQAASRLAARLAAQFGDHFDGLSTGLTTAFPRAESLVDADVEGLGVTRTRASAIRSIAGGVLSGSLPLARGLPAGVVRNALMEIRGIGPWTAAYTALRGAGDLDSIPTGDLGLRTVLGPPGRPASEAEVKAMSESWAPWRGYAAVHLWTTLL